MWDFADNKESAQLVTETLSQQKFVAAICHGSAALCQASIRHGQPALRGRRFTCLSNSEERLMKRHKAVPFSLEDRLIGHGAEFVRASDFTSHVVTDGNIITGQSMRSADEIADTLLTALKVNKGP